MSQFRRRASLAATIASVYECATQSPPCAKRSPLSLSQQREQQITAPLSMALESDCLCSNRGSASHDYITLSKSLGLSEPQLPQLSNAVIIVPLLKVRSQRGDAQKAISTVPVTGTRLVNITFYLYFYLITPHDNSKRLILSYPFWG